MNNDEDPCLIRSLKGHKESIMSIDLHPTCKYVASAGMDNVILLWDITRQVPPHKLMGHKVIHYPPRTKFMISSLVPMVRCWFPAPVTSHSSFGKSISIPKPEKWHWLKPITPESDQSASPVMDSSSPPVVMTNWWKFGRRLIGGCSTPSKAIRIGSGTASSLPLPLT